MSEAMMTTPLGMLPVDSYGMRMVVDALAAAMKRDSEQPICACGDSFTEPGAMCVNCAIGTPTDLQEAREANLKLAKEVERLRGKAMRQRKELRRLNKYWATFWAGHAVALSKART